MTPTQTHFRPHADFMSELESFNAKQATPQSTDDALTAELKRAGLWGVPMSNEQWTERLRIKRRHFPIQLGDRVIVKATGADGIVEAIDSNGIDVLVELDNGPDRGLRTFAMSEIEFWSHGR